MIKNFKVLHIGDEMSWRGGENQTLLLAKGLSEHGIASVMAYPRGSHASQRMRDLFPMVELPSRRPLDPRNIFALKKAIEEQQIQIIDAQSSNAASMGLILKKIFPDLKLVVHRRVDVPIKNNPITRWKYLSPAIDYYVAISAAIGNRLLDYGLDSARLSVVPSAIDVVPYGSFTASQERQKWMAQFAMGSENHSLSKISPFENGHAQKTLSQKVWIGFGGAIVNEKGIFDLLEALALLKKSGLDFFAPIAGDGRDFSAACKRSRELGLEHTVCFLSRVAEMPSFLATLDILVLPSHNEGLGTILLEGMAAGATVVGANVGGIPEIIRDNETGFLFSVRNRKDLAEKLKILIQDKEKRALLAANAKKHLAQHFSLEAMVSGNISVYQKILAALL